MAGGTLALWFMLLSITDSLLIVTGPGLRVVALVLTGVVVLLGTRYAPLVVFLTILRAYRRACVPVNDLERLARAACSLARWPGSKMWRCARSSPNIQP